jgi:hypothetical protein
MDANNLKEVQDYGHAEKTICNTRPGSAAFLRIFACGAGTAQVQRVLAKLYERGEGLSW